MAERTGVWAVRDGKAIEGSGATEPICDIGTCVRSVMRDRNIPSV